MDKADIFFRKDKELMNVRFIQEFLCNQSYWAKGRTEKEVKETIKNSFCVGAFLKDIQIGFGRVVTDYVTFAYIMDVFISPEYQRNGIGRLLMDEIILADELKRIKRFSLATVEAAQFYKDLGFQEKEFKQLTFIK
jgi:ribosomal protein S18 acetylase RimI-like enzyme